uniref:Uncharacterized protein n=1 Tax=Trypanosoma congolense (strain IL3000) TaxID=1068625 RepID=F9WAM5_TRYCI|nr:hypothetical protein, unlikely [Trypanosoma congolense IL3000]
MSRQLRGDPFGTSQSGSEVRVLYTALRLGATIVSHWGANTTRDDPVNQLGRPSLDPYEPGRPRSILLPTGSLTYGMPTRCCNSNAFHCRGESPFRRREPTDGDQGGTFSFDVPRPLTV